jgi:superfamily I DNA and/or RNA helicase
MIEPPSVGFLSDDTRVNVVLTREKHQLVLQYSLPVAAIKCLNAN